MAPQRPPSAEHDIRSLVESFHPIVVVETLEEERVELLVRNVASGLGLPVFEWSVTSGLRSAAGGAPAYGTADPRVLLQHIGGLTVEALFLLKDFHCYLEQPEIQRILKELADRFSRRRSTLILSGSGVSLPDDVRAVSVFYRLQFPSKQELQSAVRDAIQSLRSQARKFEILLSPDDLEDLVKGLQGLTLKQARQIIAHSIVEDGRLSRDDLQQVLKRKGEAIRDQGLLEFYPPGSNSYELGGFASLIAWLQRARLGFSEKAEALNLSPPKGILLVGVQGCGKSLAAKHTAHEWNLPLLKLDASRLYDKYIGESEKNLRKAISQAEAIAPVVLWIDEIEKALATSGGDSDGGLSRRMLGFFLTWLQEKRKPVFIVATANDVKALPPELLRKGRFDEVFFVDLPNEEERRKIFEIHLRLRNQQPDDFDLAQLATKAEGFSGAEIEQVVIAGLYRALYVQTPLNTAHLVQEIDQTSPLSYSRREEISRLRSWASERFVNVR